MIIAKDYYFHMQQNSSVLWQAVTRLFHKSFKL